MARPVVWLVEGCKVLKKISKVSINNFISSDRNTGITIQFFLSLNFSKQDNFNMRSLIILYINCGKTGRNAKVES